MKKKLMAFLLAVVMVLSLAATAGAAETISSTGGVTSLRLERADGTASVKNASGKALNLWNGMRLYNGYTVSTELSSYAYISLDSTKAVKLDASSSGEVLQAGNLLEMKLVTGSMFFDVTAPVKSNEKMTIRTTTMVTGVRGTAGWVEIVDRYTTRITLLEGELEIFNINPLTGTTRKVVLTGGQTATIVFQGKEDDYLTNIVPEEETIQELIEAGVIQDEHIILNDVGMTVEELQEEDVPGFVAVEVAKDPALQQKIEELTDLSVPEIIADAEEQLAAEETAAEKENKETQKVLEKVGAEDVDPMFEEEVKEESSGGGGGGSAPGTPPAGEEVPEAQSTVELTDPTPQQLADALADPAVTTINVYDAGVSNGGVLNDATISETQTLNLNSGTLPANGTTTVNGTVNVASGATLENNGTMDVVSTNSIHISGIMNNNGTLNIGTAEKAGLVEVQSGGQLVNDGVMQFGMKRTDGGASLENSGVVINGEGGTFFVHEDGLFTNAGAYEDNRHDALYALQQKGSTVYWLDTLASVTQIYADADILLVGAVSGDMNLGIATSAGATLDLNGRTAIIPVGETGTGEAPMAQIWTVSEGSMLTVVDKSGTGGKLRLQGSLYMGGSLTVGTGAALEIAAGAYLELEENGTLTNKNVMTNAGSFAVDEPGRFFSTGTYEDKRTDDVYAIVQDPEDATGNVMYLGSFGNVGNILSDYDGQTFTLMGATSATIRSLGIYASDVTIDLSGREITLSSYIQTGTGRSATFKNGTLRGADGFVLANTSAEITLDNVLVTTNKTPSYVIENRGDATLTLKNGSIVRNENDDGDGIAMRAGDSGGSTLITEEGCEISAGNYAVLFERSGCGGTLEDTTITSTGGTAVYFPSVDASLTIDGCTITGTAGIEAGADEWGEDGISSTLTITDSVITATVEDGYGVYLNFGLAEASIGGSETKITSQQGTALFNGSGESALTLAGGELICEAETDGDIMYYALESLDLFVVSAETALIAPTDENLYYVSEIQELIYGDTETLEDGTYRLVLMPGEPEASGSTVTLSAEDYTDEDGYVDADALYADIVAYLDERQHPDVTTINVYPRELESGPDLLLMAVPNNGGVLEVPAGRTLNIHGDGSSENGYFTQIWATCGYYYDDSGHFRINGTMNLYGTELSSSFGDLYIGEEGHLYLDEESHLNLTYGVITVDGTLENDGSIFIGDSCESITVTGEIIGDCAVEMVSGMYEDGTPKMALAHTYTAGGVTYHNFYLDVADLESITDGTLTVYGSVDAGEADFYDVVLPDLDGVTLTLDLNGNNITLAETWNVSDSDLIVTDSSNATTQTSLTASGRDTINAPGSTVTADVIMIGNGGGSDGDEFLAVRADTAADRIETNGGTIVDHMPD